MQSAKWTLMSCSKQFDWRTKICTSAPSCQPSPAHPAPDESAFQRPALLTHGTIRDDLPGWHAIGLESIGIHRKRTNNSIIVSRILMLWRRMWSYLSNRPDVAGILKSDVVESRKTLTCDTFGSRNVAFNHFNLQRLTHSFTGTNWI